MRMGVWKAYAMGGFGLLAGMACGGDDGEKAGADGGACGDLCGAAGFASGTQMDFEQNVTECVCAGSGAITQDACVSYCDGFGVPSDKSYLSMQSVANDKCVCDGTSLPSGDGSAGDGSAGDGSAGDGSAGDGSAGGDADVTLDADGFPVVPEDALGTGEAGTIHVSITESNIAILGDGAYIAPYSPNASSANTLSFLDPGFIFSQMPVMQVQLNLAPTQDGGTFECDSLTDMLIRYGNPPSGANQLVVTSCRVDYTYEAATDSYSGKIDAALGDVYSEDAEPVPTQTATFKAGFAVPRKE